MTTVRVEEDLGAELARWVEAEVRIQRGGVAQTWDELTVRELPSLPSMSPTLSARRHRFDLRFSAGPFSNEAPTTWAHELMAELPRRLELAFDDDILDGRAHASVVSDAKVEETVDDEGTRRSSSTFRSPSTCVSRPSSRVSWKSVQQP